MENSFKITLNLFKRNCYFDASPRQQRRIREWLFLDIFFYINLFLKTFGLEIEQLQLKKLEGDMPTILGILPEEHSENQKKIEYKSFRKKIRINKSQSVDLNKDKQTSIMQTIRDKLNISVEKYGILIAELTKITTIKLPSTDRVYSFMKKINKFFKINKNTLGVYVDPLEKITYVLNKGNFFSIFSLFHNIY